MSAARRVVRRRIAVVTGTRAEYGVLRCVMQAIAREPRLELQVVVTGMHLLPRFGRTIDEIRADGWPIVARVPMQTGRDGPLDQARGLARGVAGIAQALEKARSDIVLVLGDRIEAMAGGLAAVTTGRVLAHVHGGDVAPGDFDDGLRHALTKLAHVHLAATRGAARRIVRMGEHAEHVYVVGAPGLDELRELLGGGGVGVSPAKGGVGVPPGGVGVPPANRRRARATRPSGQALVVQHACGRATEVEERAAAAVLNAVRAAGLRRLIIYPNTDRGHAGVLRAIERHQRECNRAGSSAARSTAGLAAGGTSPQEGDVQIVRSMPRGEYLQALLRADVLVGNSSSGVIEAPLAGTPSVDVGFRQAGREPGGRSVVHADESQAAIRRAIERALRLHPHRNGASVYGDGQSGPRIARILAELPLTDALVRKRIRY